MPQPLQRVHLEPSAGGQVQVVEDPAGSVRLYALPGKHSSRYDIGVAVAGGVCCAYVLKGGSIVAEVYGMLSAGEALPTRPGHGAGQPVLADGALELAEASGFYIYTQAETERKGYRLTEGNAEVFYGELVRWLQAAETYLGVF